MEVVWYGIKSSKLRNSSVWEIQTASLLHRPQSRALEHESLCAKGQTFNTGPRGFQWCICIVGVSYFLGISER